MRPLDFVKAFGVALALMVLNVAIAFGVVWAYSMFIEPGHDEGFYQQAAERIAPWSSVFAGTALFFAAGWAFAKGKPSRNGVAFAATFALTYSAIDIAILVAVGTVAALAPIVAVSMVTKFVAALAGARLARV